MTDNKGVSRVYLSSEAVGSALNPPISLFSPTIKTIWVLLNLLLAMAEVIALGPMPLALYCLYYLAKVAAFFGLGFLSPLAFRRLNGIGIGVLSSFSCAVMIEVGQRMLHNGHSFHVYELVGKAIVMIVGFALALERRYKRRISFGLFAIQLAAK